MQRIHLRKMCHKNRNYEPVNSWEQATVFRQFCFADLAYSHHPCLSLCVYVCEIRSFSYVAGQINYEKKSAIHTQTLATERRKSVFYPRDVDLNIQVKNAKYYYLAKSRSYRTLMTIM